MRPNKGAFRPSNSHAQRHTVKTKVNFSCLVIIAYFFFLTNGRNTRSSEEAYLYMCVCVQC